jgi:uncharacterized protein (DUF1697 family)
MQTYVILLRGINVGGKNKVPMAQLRECLEALGFMNVTTLIASGNVVLDSALPVAKIKSQIETELTKNFKLDSKLIKVLVLSYKQLAAVVDNKPTGFGEQPAKFHSDVIFMIDATAAEAMPVFNPKEGVDTVRPGKSVIYSQRLSAKRTQSRLGKIAASPLYKSMTIRNWNTTTKLLEIMKSRK